MSKANMDRAEKMLKRLKAAHVNFAKQHKKLLASQAALNDQLQRLAAQTDETRAAKKHIDESLGTLIKMMDEWLRERRERRERGQ